MRALSKSLLYPHPPYSHNYDTRTCWLGAGTRYDVASDYFLLVLYVLRVPPLSVQSERYSNVSTNQLPLLVQNGDQMALFMNALRRRYKKLVGATTVLQATVDDAAPVIAHAYCHPSYNGSLTLTIVNPTSSSATVDLRSNGRLLSGPAQQRTAWVFTAPAGNLSSSFPVLNGRQPLRIEADGSLPPMEGAEAFDDDGTFAVPALSWSFHVVASDLPACQHAMQPL